MQRRLPLAVLKLFISSSILISSKVATALTACGIETKSCYFPHLLVFGGVATALTACGIETVKKQTLYSCVKLQRRLPLAVLKRHKIFKRETVFFCLVATALTACGIETHTILDCNLIDTQGLQQCLPLAVLKHNNYRCH